jgi:hypothetical protein
MVTVLLLVIFSASRRTLRMSRGGIKPELGAALSPSASMRLCAPSMGALQMGFKSPVEIPKHENEETII